jgi:hypothetical protein
MITSKPKSERRKADRQLRGLRVAWRQLGNRDFHFGVAALKDIGTDGLALQIDRYCPKGTVVIVQFEGTDNPLLLQAAWSKLSSTNDGTPAYLMGCTFTTPLLAKDLKTLLESAKNAKATPQKEAAASAPVQADPFLVGSASDKRSLSRRGGLAVPVVVSYDEGGTPVMASVVDRSLKGLGILIRLPFSRGASLAVRPRGTQDKSLLVRVQVSNCRKKGDQWLVGCHFTKSPPADVLMLLG